MNSDSDSLDRIKNQPDFFSSRVGEIWCQGDINLLRLPKVSIVGTREISEEGVARTKRLTAALVEKGFCIVSGLAAGVDTVAHKTALDNNGKTIAVMGTPINECFPRENLSLKERIAKSGLVLSQFRPGTPTNRGNFPKRNELMARISAVSFVVEAQAKSGTRHQVSASMEMGKKIGFLHSVAHQNYPWVTSALEAGNGVVIENVRDALRLLEAVGAARLAKKRSTASLFDDFPDLHFMSQFLDYDLRVYDIKKVGGFSRAARVVVGYPKTKVLELFNQQAEGARNYEACVNELHRQSWIGIHQSLVSITGLQNCLEEKAVLEIRVPLSWIEPDAALDSGICIWRALPDFGLGLPPCYIEATVTTSTPTELKVTGRCPMDWVQAPGTKSTEITRKILPGETFAKPDGPGVELELLGNRIWQPTLQLGDKVIVRLFFPGERR